MKRIFLITLVVLFIFGCNESQITDVKSSTDPSKQESFEKTKQYVNAVNGKVDPYEARIVRLNIDASIFVWESYIVAAVNEINSVGSGIKIEISGWEPHITIYSDEAEILRNMVVHGEKGLYYHHPNRGGATFPQNGMPGEVISMNMEHYDFNRSQADKFIMYGLIHEILHCFGFRHMRKIEQDCTWLIGTASFGEDANSIMYIPNCPDPNISCIVPSGTLSYLDKKAMWLYYPPVARSIPLNRFYNPNPGFNCHYYTNTYELYDVIKSIESSNGEYATPLTYYYYSIKNGWIYECPEGFISEYQRKDTKPLYRYYYSDGKTKSYHLTTTNLQYIVLNYKTYKKLNLVGYVYTKEISGKTVPLYEYYNSTTRDYFYTTNHDELGDGAAGYKYKRKAAHIWPMPYRYGLTLEQRSR